MSCLTFSNRRVNTLGDRDTSSVDTGSYLGDKESQLRNADIEMAINEAEATEGETTTITLGRASESTLSAGNGVHSGVSVDPESEGYTLPPERYLRFGYVLIDRYYLFVRPLPVINCTARWRNRETWCPSSWTVTHDYFRVPCACIRKRTESRCADGSVIYGEKIIRREGYFLRTSAASGHGGVG